MLLQTLTVGFFVLFTSFVNSLTIGKRVQVPDKDPTLKTLVYKVGLPKANDKITDSVMWVPATTQFSAWRITVMNQGRPYSTWEYSMLLQPSDCPSSNTPATDLPGCKPKSSSPKMLCSATTALFDAEISSAESEVYCRRA
uniref:Secreted protein n=1 Tax=Caenorhabditis japonica TaxID=281687 RepID=A0A8R1DXY1_CAEJA